MSRHSVRAAADRAPEMPEIEVSIESYAALGRSLATELPRLTRSLPEIDVPLGFVAGAASPVPADQATAAAIAGAWLEVIEDAGHFPWLETPGRVRAALDRLVGGSGRQRRATATTNVGGRGSPGHRHRGHRPALR
jgi:pimeloyl-ACP methyl ester carboxylesterase